MNTQTALPLTISPKWLLSKKVCPSSYNAFCAEFPDGCAITETNLLRAADIGLSLQWLMEVVVHQSAYANYCAKLIRPTHEEWLVMIAPLFTYYEAQGSGYHHPADHQSKLDALAISIILDCYKAKKAAAMYQHEAAKLTGLGQNVEAAI